jgi:hypothetical protein
MGKKRSKSPNKSKSTPLAPNPNREGEDAVENESLEPSEVPEDNNLNTAVPDKAEINIDPLNIPKDEETVESEEIEISHISTSNDDLTQNENESKTLPEDLVRPVVEDTQPPLEEAEINTEDDAEALTSPPKVSINEEEVVEEPKSPRSPPDELVDSYYDEEEEAEAPASPPDESVVSNKYGDAVEVETDALAHPPNELVESNNDEGIAEDKPEAPASPIDESVESKKDEDSATYVTDAPNGEEEDEAKSPQSPGSPKFRQYTRVTRDSIPFADNKSAGYSPPRAMSLGSLNAVAREKSEEDIAEETESGVHGSLMEKLERVNQSRFLSAKGLSIPDEAIPHSIITETPYLTVKSETQLKRKILIIGGGIAGLVLALCLKRLAANTELDIVPIVYEKSSDYSHFKESYMMWRYATDVLV